MSQFAREQNLDVDFETARALHRVVRGMHDGECPKCHRLFDSPAMRKSVNPTRDLICPLCGFRITAGEQEAAIQAFGPVMEKNLQVFEDWRAKL